MEILLSLIILGGLIYLAIILFNVILGVIIGAMILISLPFVWLWSKFVGKDEL